MPSIEFEHIAIALHLDDLADWDHLLRGGLGGEALVGGSVPANSFQGGQITYPGGGMLELLSWTPEPGGRSAMKRYVERHGGRSALHHVTFLVDNFDTAVERSRALGYEPMLGRNTRTWKEFFVRDAGLRPAGMLVQLLQADKETLLSQDNWGTEWEPFAAEYPPAPASVSIDGVQLASTDPAASRRLFVDLLGAEPRSTPDTAGELHWQGSPMRLFLVESETADDSHVRLAPGEPGTAQQLAEWLRKPEQPPGAHTLLRPIDDAVPA